MASAIQARPTKNDDRKRAAPLPCALHISGDAALLCPSLAARPIGTGTTVASFLAAVPWLVMLSQHKSSVFSMRAPQISFNSGKSRW
jgi:hypothetical protein